MSCLKVNVFELYVYNLFQLHQFEIPKCQICNSLFQYVNILLLLYILETSVPLTSPRWVSSKPFDFPLKTRSKYFLWFLVVQQLLLHNSYTHVFPPLSCCLVIVLSCHRGLCFCHCCCRRCCHHRCFWGGPSGARSQRSQRPL